MTRYNRSWTKPRWVPIATAIILAVPGRSAAQVERTSDLVFPDEEWTTADLRERGLSSEPFDRLIAEVAAGRHGLVNRIVVAHAGYLVVDQDFDLDYREISRGFEGPLGCGEGSCRAEDLHDFNYYHHDYHPYYAGRDVHTLQSVTKSVASAVLAIALDLETQPGGGGTSAVERRVDDWFRDRAGGAPESLEGVTLHHLLTMTSGIEWHEQDRPLDATNTTIQLERSADWIDFTLSQPRAAVPGEAWVYNSGGSQLMAGIVYAETGRHLNDIAVERLFRPIGISDHHWKKTPRGYPDALGGLYLEALDLARIGHLFLADGVWSGQRILPEGWVGAATARHVDSVNPAGWGYGYQWWRPDRRGVEVWAGLGFGGQALLVFPEFNVVAVTMAWNVFGGRANVLMPLIDAIIASANDVESSN